MLTLITGGQCFKYIVNKAYNNYKRTAIEHTN